jgi:hypothetical protein
MATVIKPTVGRVVYYYPARGTTEQAAIVAAVLSDDHVNLGVFNADGRQQPERGVKLVQGDEKPPETGHYCTWMPFQLGQAAKTEAAEKAAENQARAAGKPSAAA